MHARGADLNAHLPVAGVQQDYVQVELAVRRGAGACTDPGVINAAGVDCPVRTSRAESTIDVLLGAPPDDITTAEFSRGAQSAVSEMVTGQVEGGGGFQYRLSAWHFDSADDAGTSAVLAIASRCRTAVKKELATGIRVELTTGDEPYLIAFRRGADVYLIESIHDIKAGGTVLKVTETKSGLLPADAIHMIEGWWTHEAPIGLAAAAGAEEGTQA